MKYVILYVILLTNVTIINIIKTNNFFKIIILLRNCLIVIQKSFWNDMYSHIIAINIEASHS